MLDPIKFKYDLQLTINENDMKMTLGIWQSCTQMRTGL